VILKPRDDSSNRMPAGRDDDESDSSDSDDLFTRPGPTGDVRWSDDEDEKKTRGRGRRRMDEDEDEDERLTTVPTTVPTDTKKKRVEKSPIEGDDGSDDDDDDAWARQALLESATTTRGADPKMRDAEATSGGAKALLHALDGLARPPSPTYVPLVGEGTSGGNDDEAEDASDDDDEPVVVSMSDSERGDEDVTTHRRDDGEEFTGEMMTLYFQLPNGKKYERLIGSKMPFKSIVAAWRRSGDWADVEAELGSASVKLLFDGDVIPGTKTPNQLEMEEEDTVDVMRG
jgi:hypothetical protein